MTAMTNHDREARAILTANDRGGYTIPTEGLYPYQWNWDSAFAALGFAAFDLPRAWQEMQTLLAGQWDNGMVPHIQFHQLDDRYFPGPDVWQGTGPVASSGITQPPVALSFIPRLYRTDPAQGKGPMTTAFPALVAWVNWLMAWRCDDQGAVFVTHPWESGRDNAPCWDDAMARIDPEGVGTYTRRDTQHVDASMRPTKYDYDRYIWLVQRAARLGWEDRAVADGNPFRVADPTMTFIMLRGVRDLAAIGRELHLDTTDLDQAVPRLEAGAQSLWNPQTGHFDSRNCNTGIWGNALSNASYLCWYAGLESPEMLTHLRRVLDAAPFGIPSLDPGDPRFDAKRYWRGPTWGMMNMMIGEGLTEMGHPEGEILRQRTRDVIEKFGFVEYFNPLTGDAAGGGSFTWTAAVWLAWANKGQN